MVKEIQRRGLLERRENTDDQNGDMAVDGAAENHIVRETSRMPFLMLGLDLPPPPLFKDVMEKNIIPQVFFTVLAYVSNA